MAGWAAAVQTLAALTLLALPAAWVLRAPKRATNAPVVPRDGTGAALRRAIADRNFRLLAAGFTVCGFHVAFLSTHLPGVVAACGLPPAAGAWSLALLGLFNIIGSVGIGLLMSRGRWRMKSLLSAIYATRALAVLLFVLAPKTTPVLLFAAVMGVTFLSTVPPTAGLVARFFGTTHLATLIGLVMVAHQVGAFFGAWLGGKVFDATGSFDVIWFADILLALGAALLHLPIREPRPAQAPA